MTEKNASIDTVISTRLMLSAAAALVVMVFMIGIAAGVWQIMHLSTFNITKIYITGQTMHSNEPELRSQVLPQLKGNFFTMPLDQVRSAFQSQPWIQQAVVRRVFPNHLVVQLREHQEAAYWGSDETGFRLLSNDGIIFDANPDDALHDSLPELNGPDDMAPQVLAVYNALNPLFAPIHGRIAQLGVDARGSWSLALDQDTSLMLGNAAPQELAQRVQQFVQTIAPVVARYNRGISDVQYADLRYKSGYALRLKGLATVNTTTAGKKPETGRR